MSYEAFLIKQTQNRLAKALVKNPQLSEKEAQDLKIQTRTPTMRLMSFILAAIFYASAHILYYGELWYWVFPSAISSYQFACAMGSYRSIRNLTTKFPVATTIKAVLSQKPARLPSLNK